MFIFILSKYRKTFFKGEDCFKVLTWNLVLLLWHTLNQNIYLKRLAEVNNGDKLDLDK